jgi:hypothetical protein
VKDIDFRVDFVAGNSNKLQKLVLDEISQHHFSSLVFFSLFHSLLFQKGTKVLNLFFAKHQQMGFWCCK